MKVPPGLAMTTDVTPRYCEADPYEGGKQAVAEAWRNLTSVGARPLAVTDNLNFGSPERPETMGQIVGCIRGIGDACRALDFPGRFRQCQPLQRDQWPRDPADAEHRRRRPYRRHFARRQHRFQDRRRRRAADRRYARLARPVGLSARIVRARGWRTAAGRSCARAPDRRFRAQPDPRPQPPPRCTMCRTAGFSSPSPKWRSPPASAPGFTPRP